MVLYYSGAAIAHRVWTLRKLPVVKLNGNGRDSTSKQNKKKIREMLDMQTLIPRWTEARQESSLVAIATTDEEANLINYIVLE